MKQDYPPLPKGRSALHYAAYNKNLEVSLFSLEEKKLDPNQEDENHATPMDWVIARGTLDAMKAFIEYGANYKRENRVGLTPVIALEGRKRFKEAQQLAGFIQQVEKSQQMQINTQIKKVPNEVLQRFTSNSKTDEAPSTARKITSAFSLAGLITKITSLWKFPSTEEETQLLTSSPKLKVKNKSKIL